MLGVLNDDLGSFRALGRGHVAGVKADDADPLGEVDDRARQRQAVSDQRLTLGAQRSVLYPE